MPATAKEAAARNQKALHVRGKIIAKKAGEMKEELESAVALVQQ